MIELLAGKLFSWRVVGAGLCIVGLYAWGSTEHHRANAIAATYAAARADWGEERSRAASAAAAQAEDNRAETARRVVAQERIADEFNARAQALARDAAAARTAADGLRSQLATTVAAARRAATANPPAAAGSAPAVDHIGLLADVLIRVDDRAGELARVADERGASGAACERAYDALTPTAR